MHADNEGCIFGTRTVVTSPSRRLRLAFFGICSIGWIALLVFRLRNFFRDFGFSAGLGMCLYVGALLAIFGVIAIRQTRAASRRHPNPTNGALR
jgi:hypothetical protein